MPPTILITGFGPFPGAPFNPTEVLARHLARLRRPALADVRLVPHVFITSYQAVDRDLPLLLGTYRPSAILMFGLATRTPYLRIETSARNAVAAIADAERHAPTIRVISEREPDRLTLRTPARRLLAGGRNAKVPVALSRDAGRYLCNYLCWRATEATQAQGGPKVAAFVHVPLVRRSPQPAYRVGQKSVTMIDLARAGREFLRIMASAAALTS